MQVSRLILLFTCLAVTGHASPQTARMDPDIVGVWQASIPGSPYPLVLKIDAGGKCAIEGDTGTCQAQGGVLVFRSASSGQNRYSYKLQAGKLTLTGGDLTEPLVFRRSPGSPGASTAAPKGPFEAARGHRRAEPRPPRRPRSQPRRPNKHSRQPPAPAQAVISTSRGVSHSSRRLVGKWWIDRWRCCSAATPNPA